MDLKCLHLRIVGAFEVFVFSFIQELFVCFLLINYQIKIIGRENIDTIIFNKKNKQIYNS